MQSDFESWKYAELPTAHTDEDLRVIANESIKSRLALLDSDGWVTIKNQNGVELQEKYIEGSDIAIIKSISVLKTDDIEKILKNLYNPSWTEKSQMHKELVSYEIVKQLQDVHVVHSSFDASMITRRDFLVLRTLLKIDDQYIIAAQSINVKQIPFDDNMIRGTSFSGLLLSPVSEGYQLISVDHVDPRGWVPTMLINSYKSNADEWILNLRKTLDI